jgi:hypothetical protein
MSLVLERETPPLREDETGAIRVGSSRILLEVVIRAFQDGASPKSIVQFIGILRCHYLMFTTQLVTIFGIKML